MKQIYLVCQQWVDDAPSYMVLHAFETPEKAENYLRLMNENRRPESRYSYIIDVVDFS
jgi:hypothetical protein